MPTEVQEALSSLGAAALIPKVISPQLLEYVRRYSPLVDIVPDGHWDTNMYYFNTRNQLPDAGFVTEGGARPPSQSSYVQGGFQIRNLQAVGQVTGFAQEVTRAQIGDLLRKEVQGATKSLSWSIETGMAWGNQSATYGTRTQYDGLDVQCSTFSSSGSNVQNSLDCGAVSLATGLLDQAIDIVESNAAERVTGADYMFVMSPRARKVIAQALIAQQRFDTVKIKPGVDLMSYLDIPIVESSFLGAKGITVGTVTTSPTNSGGTLAAATYYYRLSAVMDRYGELNASAEVSQAVTGGASQVTLTLPTVASIDGASLISWRVYRSTATSSETLLGVVDAVVGFQADGITPVYTTSIVDTGAALVPYNGGTAPAVAPTSYFNTNAGILPRAAGSTGNGGGEDLYLIPRNEDNIFRPWVRGIKPIPVAATITAPDVLPFALVADTCLAVRAPKYMARLRNFLATLASTNPVYLTQSVG